MGWMRTQEEFEGVRSDMKLNKPEARIRIHRDKAGEMDVSVAAISNTLRFIFGEPTVSTVDRESERYDVITEIQRTYSVPDVVYQLYTRNGNGEMISLANLVEVEEGVGPSEIRHFNRSRSVTLSSQTPPDVPLGTALNKLEAHLKDVLPADIRQELAGEAQEFRESFFYMGITLIFSIVFIYLVLAGQFESFLHPFTILLTIPLASLGAVGALFVFGMTLNIFSFIGMIMLTGLVTKTGILLVDYANVLVTRGHSIEEAARKAAETRFRPVLMTASSTMLGMVPLALGFGAGGEARAPMGVAVIFGNLVPTSLTLLVIPVVYVMLNRLRAWLVRHRRVAIPVAACVGAIGVLASLAVYVL
jgi:multidrug efflux pump subunit AcrB